MQKNFSIRSCGAEVVVGERAIDLHNLYSTTSISTDLDGAAVTVKFQRDHKWQGPDGLPERVTLTCSGDLKMAFNDLLDTPVPLGQDALEITYYNTDCAWGDYLDEDLAAVQGFEGLQISFSGGLVLRIRSAVAEITIA